MFNPPADGPDATTTPPTPDGEAAIMPGAVSEATPEITPQLARPTAPTMAPRAEPMSTEPVDLVSTRIPHVAIHVFAESAEFAETWERAAGDRRLASAKAVLHRGGLGAAIALYRNERSPDLII